MTTLTDKELIKEIKERIGSLDVRDNIERRAYEIALASLEAEPVAKIIAHYPLGIDVGKQKFVQAIGELPDFGGHLFAAPPVPVVPEEKPMPNPLSMYAVDAVAAIAEVRGWNACRAAMLQSGNFRENKNSSTNNFREIAETSTNYPVIPSEVLSAIQKVAKIRADFDDFDGDRRGIGDCLDEAEQELIVTINKYASQLAAEPIATNDVREQQTAVPPVPEIQADVAQAIENLKQKLVECNRYNYCADAVKNVEDASRVLALQNQNMSAPITPEAIENAIEYIRSIAFHIDEDDYHGKHIAYFMRQALALLEGHSCSNDRLGKADNQPVRGNQAAESNRGNEWTGNPDIDNAIIMLDRIDTLENCDDDRIEAVKAVLRRLAGNYPDIPDSSVPAPGKGVTGERIRIKPHVYRELVNRLHDTAIKCAGTQQLRERISRVLGDVITPDHHKQAEKSGLERCHLEAALNIKPGHTLGIIDALLVHKMARALLPLVAEKHEADHANES
ncbi:TPA: dTDP-6-deoxy-L-hexose 3-O-methyltransferase [Escherichia coli]|nr:dTDP-6-deoxy-L-hexose 3-O-methyltransferase [Escherichia coli]HCW2896678.1 dTDP-6-deoxy-L-hexose 3-O-methyltransferase [Escherichia coli]HCW3034250.1 dTDP-6-deoxy-L-hexose 3-O-methyltransferase [Escherichia coli]HDL0287071.1 dTDP-6-deoxy-L-hexose 3-O-methyltransferase [Escherichia coli]HDL0317220.1 dTDP-6-deoxy-L-hexose 3-O-methyltransferase [Escherichia coli]